MKTIAPRDEQDIEPRDFTILFCCEDCQKSTEQLAHTVLLKRQATYEQTTQYLSAFHPFCCFNCGGDDFVIQKWIEGKSW